MQLSPEMINPFKPEPVLDPVEYRKDLANKIRIAKNKGNELVNEAKAKGSAKWIIQSRESERGRLAREPLRLAKWSEEYHRARLFTHGNYTVGEHGEIIEKRSGLTTQELADLAKLQDNLEYNIAQVLKILPETKLPDKLLKEGKINESAKALLWFEDYYGGSGIKPDNAEMIKKFVQTFGIEDELKKIIAGKLDSAAKYSNREYAENLLKAYPFFDFKEFRQRLESRFYPMPQGLKGQIEAKELFGEALEGPDAEISLAEIVPILADKAELLANDLIKNPDLYWELKGCITRNDKRMPYGFRRWVIKRDDQFNEGAKGKNYARVLFFLGDNADKSKRFESPRLEFHFSCDKEVAQREAREQYKDFTTTNIFKFEGLYVGNKKIRRDYSGIENGQFIRIDQKDESLSGLAALAAQKEALRVLAEELLEPEKDFQTSLARLQQLAEKWDLPQDDIEDLSRAIKEFGTYMYRKEQSDVGDCLITPSEFTSFCERKFGIKLDDARYGEYHPEWGSVGGYDPYTFLHQILVYKNRIAIDWTVTQYARHSDKPIPYIYEIGQERKSLGPLYRSYAGKKDPNEQFINDKNDSLYREELPIEYGI